MSLEFATCSRECCGFLTRFGLDMLKSGFLSQGSSAKQAFEKLGFKVVADESQLLALVQKAIAANPKAVADFKKGKLKAADAIKGFVMRETKGMAKTELVQQILLAELAKIG